MATIGPLMPTAKPMSLVDTLMMTIRANRALAIAM
jgi:hypothetical protein